MLVRSFLLSYMLIKEQNRCCEDVSWLVYFLNYDNSFNEKSLRTLPRLAEVLSLTVNVLY